MLCKKFKRSLSSGVHRVLAKLPVSNDSKDKHDSNAIGHPGRVGRLYNKAKATVKRCLDKTSSRTTPPDNAVCQTSKECTSKEQEKRVSVCSGFSDTTAVNVACQTDKEAAVEPSGPVLQDVCIGTNDYYSETLDERSLLLRRLEKAHFVGLDIGMNVRMSDPHNARVEVVEWMCRLSSDNGYSRKTLQQAITYLDLFLCDFKGFIPPKHLIYYSFACLHFARLTRNTPTAVKILVPESTMDILDNEQLDIAIEHVIKTLGWCLKEENDGKACFVRKVVDLPTIFDFLELIFQRAAIALPGRFADRLGPGTMKGGLLGDSSLDDMPRLFATRPFMHAGDIVDALLYDHDCRIFSYSELAAASFYFVADKGGITNAVFEQCTGYAIDEVWPVIEHLQGLLLNTVHIEEEPEMLGTMLCCSLQDRYFEHPDYIEHEQLWRLQSYHAHMWADFKDALSGKF